jgi:hypothetical protein
VTADSENDIIPVLVRPESTVTCPVLEGPGHFVGQVRPSLRRRKCDGEDIVVAYDATHGHIRRIIAPKRDRDHQ